MKKIAQNHFPFHIGVRAEFLEWNTTPVLPDEEAGATAAKVLPEFAK